MGAAFRKAFLRTPVAIDNWNSLKEEANRIHASFVEFNKYAKSCKNNQDLSQRYNLLKGQWWRIYNLLQNLINNVKVNDGEYICLTSENRHEWLAKMKRKMETEIANNNVMATSKLYSPLSPQPTQPSLLITIPENNETA